METTERFRVILKDYPESFEISHKRRAKYWKANGVYPKYIQNAILRGDVVPMEKGKNKELLLYDKTTKEFIIKNKKVVGTPRNQVINSQILWAGGGGSEWIRLAIENFLTAWFAPFMTRQLPEKIWLKQEQFIHFEYIFYYPFDIKLNDNSSWRQYQDYINHCFIRGKVFEDTLVKLGIIPDDSPMYVRGAYMRYVAIPTDQQRHMDVVIHFCSNTEKI